MDKEDSSIQHPSPDVIIWRYINKDKFYSLIQKKSLFFAKAETVHDPFEKSYPESFKKVYGAIYGQALYGHSTYGWLPNFYREIIKDRLFIGCFTIGNYESDIFWKAYLIGNEEGVAIQSTFEKFKSSFEPDIEEEISIGNVKYLDLKESRFQDTRVSAIFFTKKSNFNKKMK